MSDPCLTKILQGNSAYVWDQCGKTMSYTVQNTFDYAKLKQYSTKCFELYIDRLNSSEELLKIGKTEYDFANEELITRIQNLEVLNYSFSITANPSLHFFVQFKDQITLIVETYLERETDHDTYAQIRKAGMPVLKLNGKFDNVLKELIDTVEKELKGEENLVVF